MKNAYLSRKIKFQDLIGFVNRKPWWHVPPLDPNAYKKRGKFLASTFAEAEFYGRPLDEPQKVTVLKPLVGDEKTIERRLFGHLVTDLRGEPRPIKDILAFDAKRRQLALSKGYDSIILMSPTCFAKWKASGKVPRSLELNVLRP